MPLGRVNVAIHGLAGTILALGFLPLFNSLATARTKVWTTKSYLWLSTANLNSLITFPFLHASVS